MMTSLHYWELWQKNNMKNWLIRTKSNYLLGPVSREKLVQLVESGSIAPDDEICSGNGFWFFIKERDYLEKYLLQSSEVQGFNPVSEALNERRIREMNADPNHEDHLVDDITLVQISHNKNIKS